MMAILTFKWACHVVSLLEKIGASGVIIEDQQRPRRGGHSDGKRLMELDEFLTKLMRVLALAKSCLLLHVQMQSMLMKLPEG